jgi:predicted porin
MCCNALEPRLQKSAGCQIDVDNSPTSDSHWGCLGTLTFGRQATLTLDGVKAYDPMSAANPFSMIGDSAKTAGVGDTEDARFNTATKYVLDIGSFRVASTRQLGGYNQGNGSDGAYEVQIGGDFGGLSADAIFSYVRDAVSLANWSTATKVATPAEMNTLKATLSNDTSVMLLAKYTIGPAKLFGGYEYIRSGNPSDNYANGFISIGGYPVAANSVLPAP